MIKTKIISEVVGSPQEHVDKTVKLLLEKIKENKSFECKEEKIFEAQKIEGQPLYSAFIEYILEFSKLEDFTGFCFDYMPSSIEILEPAEFKMSAIDTSEMFNELMARLHQNDLLLRKVLAELEWIKREEKVDKKS